MCWGGGRGSEVRGVRRSPDGGDQRRGTMVGSWTGLDWTGLDWTGLDWTGVTRVVAWRGAAWRGRESETWTWDAGARAEGRRLNVGTRMYKRGGMGWARRREETRSGGQGRDVAARARAQAAHVRAGREREKETEKGQVVHAGVTMARCLGEAHTLEVMRDVTRRGRCRHDVYCTGTVSVYSTVHTATVTENVCFQLSPPVVSPCTCTCVHVYTYTSAAESGAVPVPPPVDCTSTAPVRASHVAHSGGGGSGFGCVRVCLVSCS